MCQTRVTAWAGSVLLAFTALGEAADTARSDERAAVEALRRRGATFRYDDEGYATAVLFTLNRTGVTNQDLRRLGEFTRLQKLDLGRSGIDDEALRTVGRLPQLNTLILNNTRITDAGLRHLHTASKLTGLDLRGTTVTLAGIRRLEEAVEGLSVMRTRDVEVYEKEGCLAVKIAQIEIIQEWVGLPLNFRRTMTVPVAGNAACWKEDGALLHRFYRVSFDIKPAKRDWGFSVNQYDVRLTRGNTTLEIGDSTFDLTEKFQTILVDVDGNAKNIPTKIRMVQTELEDLPAWLRDIYTPAPPREASVFDPGKGTYRVRRVDLDRVYLMRVSKPHEGVDESEQARGSDQEDKESDPYLLDEGDVQSLLGLARDGQADVRQQNQTSARGGLTTVLLFYGGVALENRPPRMAVVFEEVEVPEESMNQGLWYCKTSEERQTGRGFAVVFDRVPAHDAHPSISGTRHNCTWAPGGVHVNLVHRRDQYFVKQIGRWNGIGTSWQYKNGACRLQLPTEDDRLWDADGGAITDLDWAASLLKKGASAWAGPVLYLTDEGRRLHLVKDYPTFVLPRDAPRREFPKPKILRSFDLTDGVSRTIRYGYDHVPRVDGE